MKRLSLIAAALLFFAAPQVHAQAAQQQGARKADSAVASKKIAHVARSAPRAASQVAMAPADTSKKTAKTHHKSSKTSSASKMTAKSSTAPARHHTKMKAKADTTKKGT